VSYHAAPVRLNVPNATYAIIAMREKSSLFDYSIPVGHYRPYAGPAKAGSGQEAVL
jgi:hypothetical protein